MTKRKRPTTWYVHATGHTNEAIAVELAQSPEDIIRGVLCSDGVKRDMWKCDYSFVRKVLENETSNHLKFEVFRKQGKYGRAHPWEFLRPKKRTLGKSLKKGEVRLSVSDLLGAGQKQDFADLANQQDWENEM